MLSTEQRFYTVDIRITNIYYLETLSIAEFQLSKKNLLPPYRQPHI
jgi:hypothetical protein